MSTLSEAITKGQGIERPFRCMEHDDHMASASVNVLKGVWFCYACGAKGSVDKKRVPKPDELKMMMEPEKLPRIYPDSLLDLYSAPGHWQARFPDWLCWYLGLGADPFTGDATFPVHTAKGLLAGVGRRKAAVMDADGNVSIPEPRYVYPRHWSAASSVFGMWGCYPTYPALVVVEGAADAAACWEVGCPALAVYGSGIHRPQYELIARCDPELVILGFDTDAAGILATKRALADMEGRYRLARAEWFPYKDPAEAPVSDRLTRLVNAVRDTGYRQEVVNDKWGWADRVADLQARYSEGEFNGHY